MHTLEHFQLIAGVNATITAHARNEANGIFSLTGQSLNFRVGRSPRRLDSSWPIFTKGGTISDSENGVFTVSLAPADTKYLCGDYQHETWATDSSGNLAVVSEGRFRVRDPINS
jgi:hypothetical protein